MKLISAAVATSVFCAALVHAGMPYEQDCEISLNGLKVALERTLADIKKADVACLKKKGTAAEKACNAAIAAVEASTKDIEKSNTLDNCKR